MRGALRTKRAGLFSSMASLGYPGLLISSTEAVAGFGWEGGGGASLQRPKLPGTSMYPQKGKLRGFGLPFFRASRNVASKGKLRGFGLSFFRAQASKLKIIKSVIRLR